MVVLVYLPVAHVFLPFLPRVPDAGVRHLHPHLLVEEALQRVRGVDPAVGVQHVLWDVLSVDAVDGVAHVLARRHDQAEGDQQDDRDGVVQPEDWRVDVYVVDLYKILQAAEHV